MTNMIINHQIDLLAICPFYINLLLEGLEDFQIIGKVGGQCPLGNYFSMLKSEV